MTRGEFGPYVGPISPAEAAAGMNAAKRNVERLLGDARALFDRGSYASAAALAILAIEEAGKPSILRQLVLETSDEDVRKAWKSFRQHTAKNAMWLLPQLVAEGARRFDDFRRLFDRHSDHPRLLDQFKQATLYADFHGKRRWSEPSNVVTAPLASSLISVAAVMIPRREVTVREVELWVEHVGPAWRGPREKAEAAVSSWHRAVLREGLAEGDPDEVDSFIWPGFGREKDERGGAASGDR